MFSICKSVFRGVLATGVLVGLAAGGTLLLAGRHRAHAIYDEVRETVIQKIDESIDDPTAMRRELIELEKEYPKRIASVRGDLAELREQIRQLEKEQAVSSKVAEYADRDLAELEPLLAEAQVAREDGTRLVSVRFSGRTYEFDRAVSRASRIRQTRDMHTSRASEANHDLGYLNQQAQRLEDLAAQLSTEQAEFRSQIQLLSRQVDAIARNERLIGLLEERNKTIEDCSRFETISLDHVTARLSEIRSRQEAELELLANSASEPTYEELARHAVQAIEGAETILEARDERTDWTERFEPVVIGN